MSLSTRNMRRRMIRGAKKQIRRLMRAEGRDDIENRYEVYHRRGKDYIDATHERENARRVRQQERLSMISPSDPRCDYDEGA